VSDLTPNVQKTETASQRRFRFSRSILIVALLTLVMLYAFRTRLLCLAGEFLDVGGPLQGKVEAVYVLGGGLETRPFVAAEIFQAGFAPKILIPSPVLAATTDQLQSLSEAELTQQVLEKLGVPANRIEKLKQPVDSTEGEAAALREYISQHSLRRVALVTSDFHTRRTALLFGRTLRGLGVELQYVSAPTDGFCGSDWWRYEEGVETYLLEWVKLLAHTLFTR
jgi:uncharacterized SAM-binding protein YcdF (DUF218 family)